MCAKLLSRVQLFVTPWTVALQAPLSMGFSRQEYWNGLPCPPPEDLPDPGIEPESLASPALAGGFLTTSATWEAQWWWGLKCHHSAITLMKQIINGCHSSGWEVSVPFWWEGSLGEHGYTSIHTHTHTHTHTHMSESLCCPPETITTWLLIVKLYPSMK